MKALTTLLQNLSKTALVMLALVCAVAAQAQDESAAAIDTENEVLSPEQLQERLSQDLIKRAFDWSEMKIIPSKLTLEIGDIGVIYIRNKSSQSRDFRILAEDPKDGDSDMRKYLRFGPRSFRLEPEQTQVIKLIAKTPPDDVEKWRQRFSIQLLPFVEDKEAVPEEEGKLSFRLSGIYAVSIPVDVIR